MMDVKKEEKQETWKNIQVLGQGAFGYITLWMNQASNEKIAIKTCRHKEEMPDKTWERWKMEVFIMSRLNHDNVIRSVAVPPQLQPGKDSPPILAMEFCQGGDLRKVLNKPENCCGLKEFEIRQLVAGVGSGIEYLHSNRIIHRDLKPENIVLKPIDGNKTLYKIIDLGYAKELDINSICNSYVGTMQYLAPELLVGKAYSKTVDYWSLGSLVFECITGFRPFLPTLPPVEWHNVVCKKSPDDICAQYDERREIRFSKKLPSSNQLCRPLQGFFEQWLRLMLRWDPKARGGGIIQMEGVERPKCFCLLEKIIAVKIFHILHVEENTVLSFTVTDTHTIEDVNQAILHETVIPLDQQYVILADGLRLEAQALAVQSCSDSNTEDLMVFLFRSGPLQLQQKYNKKKLPLAVQAIVKEPNTLLPAKEHRKAWAQAVHWCTEISREYKRLVSAFRAALLHLLRNNSLILKQKTQMISDIGKLMACKELFQTSLDFDLQQGREVIKTSERIYQQWTEMARTINSFNDLKERVENLDNKVQTFSGEITDLQRSPVGKINQNMELEEFETKAKALYGELLGATQGTSGEGSRDMMDHHRMVDLIGKCYMKRDELTRNLYKQLSKVLDVQQRLEPLIPELNMSEGEIEAASKQLKSMQCHRQKDVWRLLKNSETHRAPGQNVEQETFSLATLNNSQNSSLFDRFKFNSLSSNLESIKLIDECQTNAQRLQEMVDTMVKEQAESLEYISTQDSITR
ncbi:unnamed protein product [Lymnaea stagnalis]|uniref:IkappaB kinase n=1 Tax=Lymnaea stagnalis TaxID=6523 RepID=A0AAV2HC23_LYMST